METWRHRLGNMERMLTWRHGDMVTWTWTWRQNQKENGSKAIFLNPVTVCLPWKQKFDIFLFVDEETNSSYPFAKD
jgi:hypothetical protein